MIDQNVNLNADTQFVEPDTIAGKIIAQNKINLQ